MIQDAENGNSLGIALEPEGKRPKVLLAAKTYANDPLNPVLSAGFCTGEGSKTRFGKNLS